MYKAGSLRAGLPSLILIDMATIFSKIITGEIPSYKVAGYQSVGKRTYIGSA